MEADGLVQEALAAAGVGVGVGSGVSAFLRPSASPRECTGVSVSVAGSEGAPVVDSLGREGSLSWGLDISWALTTEDGGSGSGRAEFTTAEEFSLFAEVLSLLPSPSSSCAQLTFSLASWMSLTHRAASSKLAARKTNVRSGVTSRKLLLDASGQKRIKRFKKCNLRTLPLSSSLSSLDQTLRSRWKG